MHHLSSSLIENYFSHALSSLNDSLLFPSLLKMRYAFRALANWKLAQYSCFYNSAASLSISSLKFLARDYYRIWNMSSLHHRGRPDLHLIFANFLSLQQYYSALKVEAHFLIKVRNWRKCLGLFIQKFWIRHNASY